MPQYIVRVEGRNLLRDLTGESRRWGFRTARATQAASAEDAGELVMNAIFEDPELRREQQNDDEDPPLLYLSSVDECAVGEAPPAEEMGYAFFEETDLDLSALLGDG